LYLDCDVIVRDFPVLFTEIVKNKYDFSILNWLSLNDNSAYIEAQSGLKIYTFSHEINYISDDQLICSGAVQFWNNSKNSFMLLFKWLEIIKLNSESQDDHCLDCAFNNFGNELNTFWLPKSYARYGWWIFDIPIIDHPHLPNNNPNFKEINEEFGYKRIMLNKLYEKKSTKLVNPGEYFSIY
jgi:hypothetical protein